MADKKVSILSLLQILKTESDAQHPLSASAILEKMSRQVTNTVLKTLENQGFFQNPTQIYDTFTTARVKL